MATRTNPAKPLTLQHRNDAWRILTGPDTVFAITKSFDGCGHLANAERVAAFGIANAATDTSINLTAEGHTHIAAKRRDLTVYFHLVGQPIPVTAVTSPQAMMAPLVVRSRKITHAASAIATARRRLRFTMLLNVPAKPPCHDFHSQLSFLIVAILVDCEC